MAPLITFDSVSYQYSAVDQPAIPAIRNVSLEIEQGEFVAVIGANGSGKSTFSRLTNGLLIPDEGFVRVDGQDTRQPTGRARIHSLVGMVFQFPEDQIIATTLEEDVAFGPENLALPAPEIRRRVEEALREVGLWEMRQRSPNTLSAGQTQRLALAGVLAMRPRCIIYDEASTMLDPHGRMDLQETMQRLNREGITMITITHFMEEAVLAKRVVVFDWGRVVMDGTPAHVFSQSSRLAELRLDLPPAMRAAAAVRASVPSLPEEILTPAQLLSALPVFSGQPAQEEASVRLPEAQPSVPLIEVEKLGYVYMRGTPRAHRALENVSLEIGEGQAHGLIGMTGSGKSTLLQHLNALLRPQEGRVRVAGFDFNDPKLDRRKVVRSVGLVFQNPEMQFFEHYVGDEIAYGPRLLKETEPPELRVPLAARVRWAMETVGLDFEMYKDRPLFTLSGGERRKVALASTLALKPEILLLDEPTAGLDPASRRDLLEKLSLMRDSGLTLVLSSHQMGDLARITRGVTLMYQGHSVLTGTTPAVFQQRSVLNQYALEPPVATLMAEALRAKGWPVAEGIMTAEALQEALAEAVRGESRER